MLSGVLISKIILCIFKVLRNLCLLHAEPSAAPETMRITSEDSNSISFTLTPPIIPNGVIIAYTLYITFDNGTSTVVVDRSGTGILTLDGLSPYQLVMVQVSANTSIGEGPRSALEEIRTQQDGMIIIAPTHCCFTSFYNL